MTLALPNYTQVPNSIFKDMAQMTEVELRCTLALVRKIIGFHKQGPEAISFSQLEKLTGLSRQGVADGIEAARKRGTVKIAGKGKRNVNLYTLNFADDDRSTEMTSEEPDQSTEATRTSQHSRPEPVNTVDTQKKDFKETPEKKVPARGALPCSPDETTHLESANADSIAPLPSDDDTDADAPESKFGWTEGDSGFWLYEPRGGYGYVKSVPITVLRFTKKRIWVHAVQKDGTSVEKCVAPTSLKREAHDLKTLADLTLEQQVIAIHSFKAQTGQGIGKNTMKRINAIIGELRATFSNGTYPTPDELKAAYRNAKFVPTDPAKVVKMVGDWRQGSDRSEPDRYDYARGEFAAYIQTGLEDDEIAEEVA